MSKRFLGLFLVIVVGAMILFTGCSGSSSGDGVDGGTGTFMARIQWPNASRLIPDNASTIYVSIEGTGITDPLTTSVSSSENVIIINDIPAGNQVATIMALDSSSNILTRRKEAFLIVNGHTADAGAVPLGVAMVASGTDIVFEPSYLEVSEGTDITIQNWTTSSVVVTDIGDNVPLQGASTDAYGMSVFPECTKTITESAVGHITGKTGILTIDVPGEEAGAFEKVAFVSWASDLVTGDTNGYQDVFIRNLSTGAVERVSVASDGTQSNGLSSNPIFSSDCRYVTFQSNGDTLVSGDNNDCYDIFVRDTTTHQTERVSVDSGGTEGNDVSYVAFITQDGRYVAFESEADNLIGVGNDTNSSMDIFFHNRETHTTERVSVASDESEGDGDSYVASLSADGRYVAFDSDATNLIGTGNDTNDSWDVFVRDRQEGETERVSVATGGVESDYDSYCAFISGNGRYVAFLSEATNLVSGDTNDCIDVFVHDRETGVTERVSVDSEGNEADYESFAVTISYDGRYVSFLSYATNLVSGDTNDCLDVFVRDRDTGATTRVSVSSGGVQANGDCGNFSTPFAVLSPDGSMVLFESYANNLITGDSNGYIDVFLRNISTSQTTIQSVDSVGGQGNDESGVLDIPKLL